MGRATGHGVGSGRPRSRMRVPLASLPAQLRSCSACAVVRARMPCQHAQQAACRCPASQVHHDRVCADLWTSGLGDHHFPEPGRLGSAGPQHEAVCHHQVWCGVLDADAAQGAATCLAGQRRQAHALRWGFPRPRPLAPKAACPAPAVHAVQARVPRRARAPAQLQHFLVPAAHAAPAPHQVPALPLLLHHCLCGELPTSCCHTCRAWPPAVPGLPFGGAAWSRPAQPCHPHDSLSLPSDPLPSVCLPPGRSSSFSG